MKAILKATYCYMMTRFSVAVDVVENGIGEQSSDPGQSSFCSDVFRKGMAPSVLCPNYE